MDGEIGRFKSDLLHDWQHVLQQVDGHLVGLFEENPQTVERYYHVIREPAAAFRGGRFLGIVAITFSQRNDFLSEAGGDVYHTCGSPAS